jgi:hypothetical protein
MGDRAGPNGKGQNGAAHSDPPPALPPAKSAAPPVVQSPRGLRGFDVVGRFLESDRWHPRRLGEHTIYRVDYAGKHGSLRCYAQVRIDLEQVVFYVVAPVKAPPDMRSRVAEFITRANYGMRIGNFELDFGDGEVRYKSALDFEAAELTPRLVRNLLYPAVSTMDRYLPGLLSVISGAAGPAEAIDAIENDD